MSARRSILAALGVPVAMLACAGGGDAELPERSRVTTAAGLLPAGEGQIDEFLSSATLKSGAQAPVHVTPEQMPWRIAVPVPHDVPEYASRKQAREAVIAAMQEWERAVTTRLPWFRLEFVEKDPDAPVQVVWKRKVVGSYAGFGGPRMRVRDGQVLAGGELTLSVKSCELCEALELDEIRLLTAHEFGHVLGLGHCLSCDSAMNYDWQTRGRAFVTEVDVSAVVALCAKPNPSVEALRSQ